MEYSYYRELKHNYLIVKNDVKENTRENGRNPESYQVKILESGNLAGFIPCDKRTINGEQFLYYRIDSMQSIKNAYSVRGLSFEQLIKLFKGMRAALENLSEYLLGVENVVLDTSSIFVDLSSGEYSFMYCPYEHDATSLPAFSESLLEIVDQNDSWAVEMVYSFCDKAQIDGALLFDCLESSLKSCDMYEEPAPIEEIPDKEPEVFSWEEEDDEEEEATEIPQKKSNKLSWKAQIIFGFLFIVLVAAMVFIRINFILSEEENLLSIVVMVVSMISGLIAFLSGIKDMTQKTEGNDISYNEEDEDEEAYEDDAYSKPIMVTSGSYSYGQTTENTTFSRVGRYHAPTKSVNDFDNSSETMVLDFEQETDKDITLYSRNFDKTIRICLDKLPITIGKMEGYVDKAIGDNSISRIHCRFSRNEEGRVVLTDLNSTNGTFRNGLKLKPHEEIFIEEGDEIKIGRICFDCR
jgi:hypothetical protein